MQLKDSAHLVLGYGSLLNHLSRLHHTALDCQGIPAFVEGWQRSWITRSHSDKQTYVGAQRCHGASVNGVLLPVAEITPALQVREQDYRFVELDKQTVTLTPAHMAGHADVLSEASTVWLCESLAADAPSAANPVCQSYVDTCLWGAYETAGEGYARDFIASTQGWPGAWVNDRHAPRYPRHTPLNGAQHALIDSLLAEYDLLKYREQWHDKHN